MNPFAFAPLISFLFLCCSGFYVLRKKTKRFFNWVFALAISVLAMIELGNFMLLISSSGVKAIFWQRWVLSGLCFLPLSWVIFSLIFARENYKRLLKKWIWYLVFISGITLGFLFLIANESLIKLAELTKAPPHFIMGSIGRYFFIYLLLSLVVVLFNFENTYRSCSGKEQNKLRLAIRGITTFLVSYIVLISFALLFSYIDARFMAFGSLAIIAGTLLVVYSALRYGFMDVDAYIGREAIYTSSTITMVGLYLFIIGLITKIIMSAGINLRVFLSFLAAFFVFLLFLAIIFSKSLKERIRLFVDKSFYKGKYDYRREWRRFSERISSIFSLDELLLAVIDAVQKIMHIKNTSIMLLDEERKRLFVAKCSSMNSAQKPQDNKEIYFDANSEFISWLWRYAQPLEIGSFSKRESTAKIYAENKTLLENLAACVSVPLICKQKLIGILNVGQKAQGERFTIEDFELLKRLSDQAAVAILNAKLSAELIIARKMESMQKISSFIIHDLKNFVSMLSLVVQNASRNIDNPQFRQDSLDTITDTVGRMNNLMSKMSALPERLELKLKTGDLNRLINDVLTKLKIEKVSRISVVQELSRVSSLKFDYEYIYKVVLNLVLNAVESLDNQGEVKVSTSQNNGFVNLTVSDTGCGMSKEYIARYLFKPFQSTKKKGLGIGLYQCRTIVEAHRGNIEVESRKHQGSSFTVRLPISEDISYGAQE